MNLTITFVLGIIVFLGVLQLLIILDIILSWLTLLGLKIRPQFLASIIDPIYKFVKGIIPTNFGPFEFAPILLFVTIEFLRILLLGFFPEIGSYLIR